MQINANKPTHSFGKNLHHLRCFFILNTSQLMMIRELPLLAVGFVMNTWNVVLENSSLWNGSRQYIILWL